MTAEHLNLAPPLTEAGRFSELVKAGQTISSSWSPQSNSLAIFIKNLLPSQTDGREEEDQPIYFASLDLVPSSERRLFISDTLVIFSAFQQFLKKARPQPEWFQSDESLTVIRKLAIDYVNFTRECWVIASQQVERPEPLQFQSEHYRSLYTCFSLFVVLYIPEPGYEQAPVGEDLIEWLNVHFIEPSTEEGDHLSALESPWEDNSFWPYLTRTVLRGLSKASLFFLNVLSKHPSDDLHQLASTLAPLIDKQPRLQNFTAERDFAHASRRWNDKVKALRIEMDRVPEESRYDDFENWWDRLSDIIGILEGRQAVIKRVCDELGADWKEICVAWSIFVDSRLRRQDLPEIAAEVLDDLPPDPTNLEDMIHAALFSGKPMEALQYAVKLDPWLAAHLADIMEPLSLTDSEIDDSALSTRDQYILLYAEYLRSDPGLWRITVDYMYSCQEIGKERADEILVRVPLRLHEQSDGSNIENRIRAGDVVGVLKDVNQTCFEHQREAVRRTVCKIASQTFVREKDYGLAISYCASAEDWPGLGRVVNGVLDEYIISGPQIFCRYAATMASSINELRGQTALPGIFLHRLIFAVRYARFHELLESHQYQDAASDIFAIFNEDIAPKSWWAVLLCDAIVLLQYSTSLLFPPSNASLMLQKLNEIFVRTAQGSGADYLGTLIRINKSGGENEALDRLKAVRLALARYFSRSTVLRSG